MKRRRLLAMAGVASTSLAGCLGSGFDKDAIVSADQASTTGDAPLVEYEALSQAEREIARTAVNEGFYHRCPELPDALRRFADRFGEPENAYLEFEGNQYAMWIRIEDVVMTRTGSPPESHPSCGLI